jgi:hypothetical protein
MNRPLIHPLLNQQGTLYRDAYALISSAVSLEEEAKKTRTAPKTDPASLYKKSIELLSQAMRMEFPPELW